MFFVLSSGLSLNANDPHGMLDNMGGDDSVRTYIHNPHSHPHLSSLFLFFTHTYTLSLLHIHSCALLFRYSLYLLVVIYFMLILIVCVRVRPVHAWMDDFILVRIWFSRR